MKIIHTSDWHLGKMLDGFSRLSEQEEFLKEFEGIVRENNADMVIIAGDVYDSVNPPARAEKMFYDAMENISERGKRCVIVIAGNHDSPERLVSANSLACQDGIIILGVPGDYPEKQKFSGFEITSSGPGFMQIEIKGEKTDILALPYPSEKRLGEVLYGDLDDSSMQKSYSDRIKEYFDKISDKLDDDCINIAVTHLYVGGGTLCDSERPIEIGGSLDVSASVFPEKVQYVALGHLHNMQRISDKVYYSGSPIQYSKSEADKSKGCYLIDIKAGSKPDIKNIYFKNYKPIDIWKCKSIEDAIEKCRENTERNSWVYIEVQTDRVITQSEIKEMHDLKKDIIEIRPVIDITEEDDGIKNIEDKRMDELFSEFYKHVTGTLPDKEIIDMFLSIAGEDDEDETEES